VVAATAVGSLPVTLSPLYFMRTLPKVLLQRDQPFSPPTPPAGSPPVLLFLGVWDVGARHPNIPISSLANATFAHLDLTFNGQISWCC